MLSYLLSKPKKSLKCARACAIINGTYLSSKKRNGVLKKAGIIFDGASIIMPPFFFEFGRITLKNNVYINSGCTFLDNANISIGENSLSRTQRHIKYSGPSNRPHHAKYRG